MSLVINLLGGPGIGKSTLAAEIFVNLKKRRIKCEYITEYAKDKTWEESKMTLENQIYVFGKQQHKMFRVNNKVDYLVCDSPLILSIIYGNLTPESNFYKLIMEEFNKYRNLNIYLTRKTEYDPIGRNQNESGAIELDQSIKKVIDENNLPYIEYDINSDINILIEKIIKEHEYGK